MWKYIGPVIVTAIRLRKDGANITVFSRISFSGKENESRRGCEYRCESEINLREVEKIEMWSHDQKRNICSNNKSSLISKGLCYVKNTYGFHY